MNKPVQKWATYLCDAKLLAKLSEGDIVDTESLYHKECLTKLYNQFKSKAEQPESEILRAIERKALSDVVNYVKDTIRTCHEINSTPVFTQTSLTDMYNEKLIFHGAAEEFTKKTHCTHLREKIITKYLGSVIQRMVERLR